MNNNQDYGIDAIESLSFKDGVRRRIQMYLGSATTEGLWQGLKEIINNSTDEALAGYGKQIIITVKEKDQEFSVRDFGRSVPFGFREDGENVLVSIFSKAHTGGKFDHKAYAQSTGTNGIGASATTLSSEYFQVESYRDGQVAIARFEEGENTLYTETTTKEKNGTFIFYKPSSKVFIDADGPLTYERVKKEVENLSYLNSGVEFIVKDIDNNIENKYLAKNGVIDFINNKITNTIISTPIYSSEKDETDEIEVALTWTTGREQFYCFVNGGYCNEGGSPITAIKTAVTNAMKKYISKEIEPEIFRKGLCCVVNCKVANPSFEGQTKNKILNTSLRTLAGRAAKEGLENFSNTSDFTIIAEMINKIAKAEKAADKAREAVLNRNKEIKEMKNQKIAFIKKLSDAEHFGEDSILCVVEGNSAGNACAEGRDPKNYGIMRLRGKMRNGLKETEESDNEYYKNDEIKLLIYALGIDLDNYNPKNLRYGKIAICVDADDDGFHVALLLLANLYKLCPQFIEENRVYWLRSPLFIEQDKKGHPISWYYSNEEFNKVRGSLKGSVKRIKGLGGLNAEDLKATMFSATGGQRMDRIISSSEGLKQLAELMGTDIKPRKDFVMNNIDFSQYGNM